MIFLKSQSNKKRLTKLLVIGFLVLAGLGFGGGVGAAETTFADVIKNFSININESLYSDSNNYNSIDRISNGFETPIIYKWESIDDGVPDRFYIFNIGSGGSVDAYLVSEDQYNFLKDKFGSDALLLSVKANESAIELSNNLRIAQGGKLDEWNKQKQAIDTQIETDAAINKGQSTLGGIADVIGELIAWIFYYIAVGLDRLLMHLINLMLSVVLFNKFVSQPIVQQGWGMIRDLCNGIFIILMMVMAAGITVKAPGYQWRSMLPKILSAAILVNFSLTITGLLIDVSQVVMLAFAAPLAGTMGHGLILQAIGLPGKYEFADVLSSNNDKTNTNRIGWIDIITALLFAVITSIIAIVVVGAITLTLIWRIILLIFLCILSPFPYIARAAADKIKPLGELSSQWSSRFNNMLVVGPAMMFFLYLSFRAMQFSNGGNLLTDPNVNDVIGMRTEDSNYGNSNFQRINNRDYDAITDAFSLSGLFKFLLVVGFLWLSLEMGKKFGDAAGSISAKAQGKVMSGLKSYSGFNLGMKGVKAVANKASALPGTAVKMAGAKLGTGTLGLTSVAVGGLGSITGSTGLQKLGEVGKQWRQDVLGGRRKNRQAKLSKFMGKIGAGSDAMKEKWGEFTDTDFAKRAKTVGLGVTCSHRSRRRFGINCTNRWYGWCDFTSFGCWIFGWRWSLGRNVFGSKSE